MKIVIVCPVRKSRPDVSDMVKNYIAKLKSEGHEVFSYWDTLMDADLTGSDIAEKHMEACRRCDEAHVFWDESSRGSHFELGSLAILNKTIVFIAMLTPVDHGQSYIKALCERSPESVRWEVYGIPRP